MSEAMIRLYKPDTPLRDQLLKTSVAVEMMIRLDDCFGDERIHFSHWPWGDYHQERKESVAQTIYLQPGDEKTARRVVGKLIRLFGFKPFVKKTGEAELEAFFVFAGIQVRVGQYRPSTCRLVEAEVVIPAKPAQEAEPERIEKKMIVVCDGQSEEAKDSGEEIAVEVPEEVPF